MVRGKGTGQVLSESEKESIRELKSEAEETLGARKEFGEGTAATQIDEGKLKAEIAHYDKMLHDGSPVIRGKRYDDLMREGLRISELLVRGLPTKEEMAHPAKNPGAVRKHMKWVTTHAPAIHRYDEIKRTLGPDCELPSVEQLRKEK
jgi:hypothetical protein